MEDRKSFAGGLWIAVESAVLATLCCSSPLILVPLFVLLGVGSVTAALRIPEYKTVFIVLSVVFLLVSLYIELKSRNKGVCNVNTICKEWWFVASVVVAYVILAAVIFYFLLPILAGIIYSIVPPTIS